MISRAVLAYGAWYLSRSMRGERRAACVAMFASALAGVACRRSAEAPAPAAPLADARGDGAPRAAATRRDAAAADAQAAASDEDAATAAARLNAAICRRPRCCVTRVMPAGIGADGTRYTVVRVDLHPGGRRCAPPQIGEQEDVVDPAAIKANEEGLNNEKVCERYRWDLVAEQGGKLRWRQPLEIDEWCTSAFGAGGGLDEMSTDAAARTIRYVHEFGSAWRSDEAVTVGVDPLRVVKTSTRSWWGIGTDEHRVEWGWDTFSGTQSSATTFCRIGPSPDAGFPDEARDAPTGTRDEPVAASDDVIIPQVTLPDAFVKEGWTTTALGACAAFLDGKDSGFTIHGPARGDSADSEMRVVMSSGGVLFVEVTDDRWVPSAKSWVKADHLELWRVGADASSGGGSGCFQPDPDAKALQWGIGLGGQVYKGHGAPAADPTVRVSRTERGARFRIVLPDEGRGLTVVYSDSDDGARQKRLIATSRLTFGRTWTVGSVTTIARERATCVVDGAQLRPKVAALPRTPDLFFRNLPSEFGDAIR